MIGSLLWRLIAPRIGVYDIDDAMIEQMLEAIREEGARLNPERQCA